MSRNHAAMNARHWERVRRGVFESKGRRCSKCGKAGRLEVHHVVPMAAGGTNDLSNLIVFCRGCHIAHHRPAVGETERAWQVQIAELREMR